MTEEKENTILKNTEEDILEKAYEETLVHIEEGAIITGKVIKIMEKEVIININYKSEAIISLNEFETDKTGNPVIHMGDKVNLFVESLEENEKGEIICLSKTRADKLQNWEKICRAYENNELITGKIIKVVKGGLKVDIGVEAFLPTSHVDFQQVQNFEEYIGKTYLMRIIKLDRRQGNIVVSRKLALREEKEKKKKDILKQLKVGEKRIGIVKKIVEYAAFIDFVDIEGINGFLYIGDMSWKKIKNPQEVISVGEKIEVVILAIDEEKERISVGLKQKEKDPWFDVEEKYPVNSRAEGKISKITDYGIFVELEEGIDGLIHISDISWGKRPKHPTKYFKEQDRIEVMVLKVDKKERKISLGIKQLTENPWLTVESRYPVGSKVMGVVQMLTNYGAFVELEENIEGLIHISDMSWTQNIQHPSEILKVGDKVEMVVLYVDKESEKIALGLKQLRKDPWETIPELYKEGFYVEGKVKRIVSFGAFIELESEVEGLVHISQLAKQKVNTEEVLSVGQKVWVKIIKVDPTERKISLSIKE